MVHIDEYRLELYILGDPAAGDRAVIEAHVRECAGCRALVEQVTAYYRDADREYAEHIPSPGRERDFRPAIVRSAIQVHTRRLPGRLPIPNTGIDRFARFGRRHPFAALGGSLVVLGGAAFGVSLLLESPSTDKNPSYVHLNPASNTFEVYNREDGLLKIMPSKWVPAAIEQERRTGYPLSVVTDLNGDGRNEIVTRMVFDRDTEPDFRLIRVFSPDLKILHEVTIGRAVTFNGVEYHGAMPVTHNMAGAFGGGETKEILAAGTNGRSPCVLSRFDNECRLLGEFWHFGNLPVVREVSLPPDTGRLILLAGVNDVHDARWESFPVIIVIDPRRISGITESVGTRGFGMAPSDAEVMYIRLPRDAVSRALNHKGLVTYMSPLSYRDGNRYSFRYQSDDAEPFADYDFIFSTDFRFVTVKTSDRTRQVYAALVNAGKLTGSLDDAFLANLAHGVRYWNGSAWREECVRVAKRYTPPDSARMNRYMKSTPR